MAKKKDKKARPPSRSDAVRSAVDQAFSASAAQGAAAAEQGRERAQDMIDQLALAAGRVRDVLDELRPPTGEDLKGLRTQIAALERRVAALEAAQRTPARTRKPAAKRSAGKSA
jgi:polyhydroxyalkanoate synthesis regulator phasin